MGNEIDEADRCVNELLYDAQSKQWLTEEELDKKSETERRMDALWDEFESEDLQRRGK